MSLSDPKVKKALKEMGISGDDLEFLRMSKSQEEGDAYLKKLKGFCKKGFRDQARKLHPDMNGGDEAKTKSFKSLLAVYEGFMGSTYTWNPPVPRRGSPFRVHTDAGRSNAGERQAANDLMRAWQEILSSTKGASADIPINNQAHRTRSYWDKDSRSKVEAELSAHQAKWEAQIDAQQAKWAAEREDAGKKVAQDLQRQKQKAARDRRVSDKRMSAILAERAQQASKDTGSVHQFRGQSAPSPKGPSGFTSTSELSESEDVFQASLHRMARDGEFG